MMAVKDRRSVMDGVMSGPFVSMAAEAQVDLLFKSLQQQQPPPPPPPPSSSPLPRPSPAQPKSDEVACCSDAHLPESVTD